MIATPAFADPVYNPENGHYYEYVGFADQFNYSTEWLWQQSNSQLHWFDGNRGHLATITSASENAFVTSLLPHDSRVWIGLSDRNSEGEYYWTNGEPFSYSNWNPNQPDNANNDENYIELLQYSGKWNDNVSNYDDIDGKVIEYTPGISAPVWNPENGHYYELVYSPNTVWLFAESIASVSEIDGIRGHLVTITSQSENDFVASLSDDDFRPWIGLYDRNADGGYKWVTGEPFEYSNWSPGEPSADTYENYVEFFASNDKWNNSNLRNEFTDGYIVEYNPYPWYNSENGHHYEFINAPGISWTDAKAAAENSVYNGIYGHLVTITSEHENDFVGLLGPYDAYPWIGLSDADTEGEYKWVTGEPFTYSNWYSGQPDNYNNEDYVGFWPFDEWMDTTNDDNSITGYVIEYDHSPPVLNPENGHHYQFIASPNVHGSDAAHGANSLEFNGIGGHLVTITSQSENDFVAGLVPHDFRAWIGLSDAYDEGNHLWVTGEPFTYSNWSPGQPDNANNDEDYIEFWGHNDKWNDNSNYNGSPHGYVVEYSLPYFPPVLNPENGHYYDTIITEEISWTDANNAAESSMFRGVNGTLVTITSQSENDFVDGLISNDFHAWIGLSYVTSQGGYKWVTGESLNYTHWAPNEPNSIHNKEYDGVTISNNNWYTNNHSTLNSVYIIEYAPP